MKLAKAMRVARLLAEADNELYDEMASAVIPYVRNNPQVRLSLLPQLLELGFLRIMVARTEDPEIFRVSVWLQGVEFYVLAGSRVIESCALRVPADGQELWTREGHRI